MNTVRSEEDSMEVIDVLADRLWGAQTRHSLEHFYVSTEKIPISLIHALALTKRVAAKVNKNLGLLSEEKASAIRQAADEVPAGQHDDELPLTIWQTGSGTRSDMSMNEVLVNQASELPGGVCGIGRKVHFNNDVNENQSSNDVFPTVIHAAALLALHKQLIPQPKTLTQTLSEKSRVSVDTVRIGCIHLQDATPLALGQEISGWVVMLEHNLKHTEYSLSHAAELTLGGTAVGTGLNTHPRYMRHIADELAVTTCAPLVTAPDRFETSTTYDTPVQAHDALKGLTAPLMKIANDVHWLASGPRCGIGEISIPENEPGSSIIPGKVNPTQCEVLTVLCYRAIGNDVAISMGGTSDSSELNIFRPITTHNFPQSVRLLADGMESFNKHCAMGIEPDRERINQLLSEPLVLVATLNTHAGHDKAVEIAKEAHREGLTLKAMVLALGYPSEAEFDRRVRPEQMADSIKAGG